MTTKADYNAEEWAKLVEAPLLASMRVASSDRGGTIRESMAVARAYAEARRHQGSNDLLDAIVASPPALDPGQLQQSGGDLADLARRRLTEAVAVLDAKAAPEDRTAYTQFVLTIAEAAANANREGGFIGIGGKPVSSHEQAALDEIRAVLNGRT